MVGSTLAMPPARSSLTSSFSVSDANNEVVCPLRNQDGSSCRKRCLGEKRYRSMQEHIRRAHPEHYISKLPATEESFQLMINTPPSERPPPQPSSSIAPRGYHERQYYREDSSSPNTPRNLDEYNAGSMLPAASAAAALAQLHNHKIEPDWDSEGDWMSDTEAHTKAMRSSIELPPMRRPNHLDVTSEPFPSLTAERPRNLLPSILSTSPPGRSSTLPPIQRHGSVTRPRKQSVSKRAREPQHKRQKSKEQMHMRRMSYDRKAFSAEPSSQLSVFGKRWEDLIDAATSATEDVDEDRTPVPQSPQVPSSPLNRNSMPPFSASHFQGYQASPLQQALTPPSYAVEPPGSAYPAYPEPFPSVEADSAGDNFHNPPPLSDSSPSFSFSGVSATHTSSQSHRNSSHRNSDPQHTSSHRNSGVSASARDNMGATIIEIYCAACQRVSDLKESYACTECICGLCRECVDVLVAEHGARRKCPRCSAVGGRFKPFQLDVR